MRLFLDRETNKIFSWFSICCIYTILSPSLSLCLFLSVSNKKISLSLSLSLSLKQKNVWWLFFVIGLRFRSWYIVERLKVHPIFILVKLVGLDFNESTQTALVKPNPNERSQTMFNTLRIVFCGLKKKIQEA